MAHLLKKCTIALKWDHGTLQSQNLSENDGYAKNRTRGCWVRKRKNSPHLKIFLLTFESGN